MECTLNEKKFNLISIISLRKITKLQKYNHCIEKHVKYNINQTHTHKMFTISTREKIHRLIKLIFGLVFGLVPPKS